MEKTFLRMTARPSARHAYVQAEVATALARQIRTIRLQRGWSQQALARLLGTTQAAVSRLEDPSYGRISLTTLLELSKVFDTGLQVRFVSIVRMLRDTWQPKPDALRVPTFEEESTGVRFVAAHAQPSTVYVKLNVPSSAISHAVAARGSDTGGYGASGALVSLVQTRSAPFTQLIETLHD